MDPISLITLAAVSGSAIIGKKVLEKSTEHVWDRFITRLQQKAQGDDHDTTVLTKPNDPQQVYEVVQTINAHHDPELITLAEQFTAAIQQIAPNQYMQVADKIINIQTNWGGINFY